MQEEERDEVSICPSFSSYSSGKLAQIAIKVVTEEFSSTDSHNESLNESTNDGVDDEVDIDFEFALVRTDLDEALLPAGAQIHPIFPVFNSDLLLDDDDHEVVDGESEPRDVSVMRLPLKNLFIGEGDIPSSSSSEADELETLPPGTYCVWSPVASQGRCKKSNSTGSSSKCTKRWRFRDLLRRSSSDGKDPFMLLTPQTKNTAKKIEAKSEKTENTSRESRSSVEVKVAGKSKANEVAASKKVVSAHEVFYVRNRAMKEIDKRRSYLPYKQDIVGLFANNVSGLSLTKNFPPF